MSAGTGRIPLWIVATVAGTGVLVVVGLFFYGAYAGLGSSLQAKSLNVKLCHNEAGLDAKSST